MRRKYTARLLTQILFIVFFVTLATGLLSYSLTSRQVKRDTFNHNIEILRQTRTLVETVLKQIERTTYTLAINKDVEYLLHNRWVVNEEYQTLVRVNDLFIDRTQASDFIHSVSMYSLENDKIISDSGIIGLDLYKDRGLIAGFMEFSKQTVWLNTRVISPDTVRYTNVISFLVKVPFGTGRTRGVLMMNVVEDFLYKTAVGVNAARLGKVYILDKAGMILSNIRKDQLYRHSELLPPETEFQTQGYFIDSDDGERQLVSYFVSSYNDWTYVAVSPYDAVMGESRLILIVTLLVSGFSLIVGTGLSLLVSRVHYRPIRKIAMELEEYNPEHPEADADDALAYIGDSMHRLLHENEEFQKRYQENRIVLREHFLFDLFLGRESDVTRIQERLEYFGIQLLPGSFAVMILRAMDEEVVQGPSMDDRNLVAYGLAMKADTMVNRRCNGFVVNRGWDELAVLMNFPDYITAEAARDIAGRVAEEIRSSMGVGVSGNILIGIGDAYDAVTDIRLSYTEALEALNYQGVAGKGNIIHIDDISGSKGVRRSVMDFESLKEGAITALRSGNHREAVRRIEEIIGFLFGQEEIGILQRKAFLLDLANATMGVALSRSRTADIRFMNEDTNPLYEFERLKGEDEIKAWFGDMVDGVAGAMGETPFGNSRDVIESVKRYIDEKFSEQIDLNCIADMTRLNARYFCRIFKEETGTTYFEYLTSRRLAAARRLLEQTDKPVHEIAAETGFINKKNIARAFRKYLGMTPSEYRTSTVIRGLSGTSQVS
jgi:two-component system, response regulator YesN